MLVPSAVAIVNSANHPLLIRTCLDELDKEEATKLIYLLHASLDIVEEKAEQPTSRDNFLGLLYHCEQYRIYGLMSTTKIKILLMISHRYNYEAPRENDIRVLLKNIHRTYIDATVMNPFYYPNEQIKSKRLNVYLDTVFQLNASGASPTPTNTSDKSSIPPIGGAVVQTV